MIHVQKMPEPKAPVFDFEGQVRQPGRRILMELRGDPNAPRRRGPKRSAVAKIATKHLQKSSLWARCLPALAEAYGHICAYSCVRVDTVTGAPTVDHWKPKEQYPDDAYEWDNYRFSCLTMNRRKGLDETLCDPFEVRDEWFLLDLVTFGLSPTPGLPEKLRCQVQRTIDVLELDLPPMRRRRERAWARFKGHPSRHTWKVLVEECPLVARQYVRQRGMPPEAQPP